MKSLAMKLLLLCAISIGAAMWLFSCPVGWYSAKAHAVADWEEAKHDYQTELRRTEFWRAVRDRTGNVPIEEKPIYDKAVAFVSRARSEGVTDWNDLPIYGKFNPAFDLADARAIQSPHEYFFSGPPQGNISAITGYSDRFIDDLHLVAVNGGRGPHTDSWPLPTPPEMPDAQAAAHAALHAPFIIGLFAWLIALVVRLRMSDLDFKIAHLQWKLTKCIKQKYRLTDVKGRGCSDEIVKTLDVTITNTKRAIEQLEGIKQLKKAERVALTKQIADQRIHTFADKLNEEALAVSLVADAYAELGVDEVRIKAV